MQVFADEELERLREFPEIGRDELARFFTLTPADVAFVDPGRGRGAPDRLGLAVALCTLPWLGFVPAKIRAAPAVAVVRLIEAEAQISRTVYDNVTDLLNLQVDLLFFDTTSTYFELDEPDEPVWRDRRGHRVADSTDGDAAVKEAGFRTYGKSKDSRPDLPQVVIGMAVTRDGIPVRWWCWPGNTGDSALIRQVKDNMRDWSLARVVWVADRGFTSAENRRYLQRAGGHYILGEKLRGDSDEAKTALARQGRYTTVAGNLQVKEVNLDDADDRFVICFNPDAADRDATIRQRMLAHLDEAIAGSDTLSRDKRAELRGVLSTKPGLKRYLRVTPGGLLRVDKKAIDREADLDGKFLLRCSDLKLSSEDIALGYKQLLEVERGWRDEADHRPAVGLSPT